MSFIKSGRGKRMLIHRTCNDTEYRAYCGSLIGGKFSQRLAGVKSDSPHYCQKCRAAYAAMMGGFALEPAVQTDVKVAP